MSHRRPLIRLAAFASVLLVTASSTSLTGANPPRYRAHVYPTLDDYAYAFAAALTEDGAIVGHAASEPFHPVSSAVITDDDAILELPSDFVIFNQALGAGGEGLVVGMMNQAPARWINGKGELLTMAPGYGQGAAWGANASGIIVGTHTNDLFGIDLPVYWTSAEVAAQFLPNPGGASGAAFAVNGSGTIVGAAAPNGTLQAVRWDDAQSNPVVIGPLRGGFGGEARAINSAGDIAGRTSFPDFSSRAMLYLAAEDQLINLGVLGRSYSEARGVNALRQVVGVSSTDGGEVHAFLWQDGQMLDLNDLVKASNEPFLYVTQAVAIDDTGRIAAEVVVGDVPDGPWRIARLDPCAPADLDCNGVIDGADLGLQLAQWGPCGSAPCDGDLNRDGVVNGADLGMLLSSWSQ